MNQKNNGLIFNESIDQNDDSLLISQNQNDKIKEKLMDKYDLSSKEADIILSKLERKQKLNIDYGEISNKYVSNQSFRNEETDFDLERNSNKHINENYFNQEKDKNGMVDKVNFEKKQNIIFKKQTIDEKPTFHNKKSTFNLENNIRKEKNVDSIIQDIVPNYNNQISIKLDHVDLTFEVRDEKVDTLKEIFIRTLKRNVSNKIKVHALKDISFEIFRGEKVGIIGYNGAGKSTLLNVITGIYPPDKGNVYAYGKISPLLSLGAGFDMNFSGRKNIILNGAVLGYDKKYLESKIDEIIEFSELEEFIDIPIKNYSSGMLAKLGFSIATSVNPDILIIDEILGVGDVNFRKKSADKIKSLMDGGTTVLLVSHSILQIRDLCDKAIWLDNGSVRKIGEVNKVCDEYLRDAENASTEQLANIKLIK